MKKSPRHFAVDRLPPFPMGEIGHSVIARRSAGRDVIDLSQLNPSLPPAGGAVERLVQASLLPHNHKYSSSQGIHRLREAMAEWYLRRFGVTVCSDTEIAVTLGTKQGLSHLLYAILTPGDTVLLPTPCYPIHSAGVVLAGGRCSLVPLPRTGGVHTQQLTEASDEFFESLESAYQSTWPRPSVMLLSFPHNPTGAAASRGFLERLLRFADHVGLYIIHDFAYADLSLCETETPSLLSIPGAHERCVELYSVSKGLSMPGWRVGLCAGNRELITALKKIKSYLDCGVFQPLQIAAIYAFEKYESIIAETREVYSARQSALLSGLRSLGWNHRRPGGSLFAWAQIPEAYRRMGSLACCRHILEQCDVAICPGIGFDPGADEFVRFALSESEERIRSAFRAIHRLTHGEGLPETSVEARL